MDVSENIRVDAFSRRLHMDLQDGTRVQLIYRGVRDWPRRGGARRNHHGSG